MFPSDQLAQRSSSSSSVAASRVSAATAGPTDSTCDQDEAYATRIAPNGTCSTVGAGYGTGDLRSTRTTRRCFPAHGRHGREPNAQELRDPAGSRYGRAANRHIIGVDRSRRRHVIAPSRKRVRCIEAPARRRRPDCDWRHRSITRRMQPAKYVSGRLDRSSLEEETGTEANCAWPPTLVHRVRCLRNRPHGEDFGTSALTAHPSAPKHSSARA